jgi:hypothetical protein
MQITCAKLENTQIIFIVSQINKFYGISETPQRQKTNISKKRILTDLWSVKYKKWVW